MSRFREIEPEDENWCLAWPDEDEPRELDEFDLAELDPGPAPSDANVDCGSDSQGRTR